MREVEKILITELSLGIIDRSEFKIDDVSGEIVLAGDHIYRLFFFFRDELYDPFFDDIESVEEFYIPLDSLKGMDLEIKKGLRRRFRSMMFF